MRDCYGQEQQLGQGLEQDYRTSTRSQLTAQQFLMHTSLRQVCHGKSTAKCTESNSESPERGMVKLMATAQSNHGKTAKLLCSFTVVNLLVWYKGLEDGDFADKVPAKNETFTMEDVSPLSELPLSAEMNVSIV